MHSFSRLASKFSQEAFSHRKITKDGNTPRLMKGVKGGTKTAVAHLDPIGCAGFFHRVRAYKCASTSSTPGANLQWLVQLLVV